MPQKNMPDDWQAPYPSWSATFDPEVAHVVIAYVAVQSVSSDVAHFHNWMQDCFSIAGAPEQVERASFTDSSGYMNDVYVCYWTDEENYQSWSRNPRFSAWWEDDARLVEEIGYWREVIVTPMNRLETLFSSEDAAGLAATTKQFTGPIDEHGYWGGMRDRIPDSENDALLNTSITRLEAVTNVNSQGKRLRIPAPENMCLIRSAQNWTHCQGEELDIYRNDVQPVLIEGMNFIRDNPLETGCITCRFMDELSITGETQLKTFGMAYFLTMADLEEWAKSHPTHLAIFQSFHKMVQKLDFKVDLKLWHEVIVLSADEHVFEYINCHEKTGLLPYFPAN